MGNTAGTRQQPGLACEECRRRKGRCDRVRPQCGVCAEAGRNCVVVDKRSQRGPKKGQLKDLRSRVAVLEQRLVTQSKTFESDASQAGSNELTPEAEASDDMGMYANTDMEIGVDPLRMLDFPSSDKMAGSPDLTTISNMYENWHGAGGLCSPGTFTSNSIQVAPITPPSPSKSTTPQLLPAPCDGEFDIPDLVGVELDLLYFERVHYITPMIHKRRYLAWAGDENPSPAKACLRLAMRTLAAAMSAHYGTFSDVLYATARRMLESQDVHNDAGMPWITRISGRREQIEHERIQAWLLLAHYEFMRKTEHQAILTAERAFRLLQLSRLFDIDLHDSDAASSKHSAPSSSDSSDGLPAGLSASDEAWIELEEKRRTLWTAFVLDRLSSMLNNQPFMLHEEIIRTRLPMDEADFQNGCDEPSRMGYLPETMGSSGNCSSLPAFAECVLLANLFGRCVAHRRLAQSMPLSGSESEAQDFWARHEWLAATAAAATRRRLYAQNAIAAATRDSASPKCNPTLWFNRILAYSASVSLSDTAEANPWLTFDGHLMAMNYKQLAYDAAAEIVLLIKTAPRIAFFKMHPFVPNVMSLVASFLKTAIPHFASSDEERQDHVESLLEALRRLSEINNLARDVLFKLEADILQTTSSIAETARPEWAA
ncbi:hypothetical protein QQS21_002513 [Conoideocrella luteorostrata]|uniref:Zn(2)-C6 fungal-type domain-containing protein n=1 Tax=Conoideocrella luteorostrata TaxID=1105319 RepID=A0AAJ0CZ46_9HYPO|nr:hypothetical protein QQS21_002513 [Conoideocrella luteorostrata]